MQEMEQIGETGIKKYILNRTDLPTKSTLNTTVAKKLKPMIIPQETPNDVLIRIFKTTNYENMADYESIIKHLEAYQKGGDCRKWDEYAEKIPHDLRMILKNILTECARNGFIAPYVYGRKLKWNRIMTHGPSTNDLCTLCRRDCDIRTDIETGKNKNKKQYNPEFQEPRKCWEK